MVVGYLSSSYMTGAKRRITIQAKNMIPYLKNN
jgi:hypothetical protein